MIKAILFDMDGVILDSMPYHFIAWFEAFREYGISVTNFDIYEKEGEPWPYLLKRALEKNGKKPTEELMQSIFKLRQEIFHKYFKPYIFDYAPKLITDLKAKKFKLGLVSGTPKHDIEAILPTDLLQKFDCIVGGDMVTKGKPDPEPYLTAAKLLEVKPKECIAIENAPLGISSAKSAGMTCYAIATSLPPEYLKKADKVVQSLREISI